MKSAKNKKATSNKDDKRAKLREDLKGKGPLRLKKYAVAGLKIPAAIVDDWNDFDKMIDYCVAKAMGDDLPDMGDEGSEETYQEEGEFDASGMMDDKEEGSGESEDNFEDEMDGDGGGMFEAPEDEEDTKEEEESTPEPEKPKAAKKRRTKKEKAPAPPAEDSDITTQLQGMLDVITNQGVVIDKLKDDVRLTKSTVQEIYVRQESTHRALAVVAKTVFKISAVVSGFVPRALKAMRFKPQATKDIQNKAEAAGKDAEEIVLGLLDPEAD